MLVVTRPLSEISSPLSHTRGPYRYRTELHGNRRTTRHVRYCYVRQRFRSVDHLATHYISIRRLNGCSNNIQHAVQFSWLSPPVCGHQHHAIHGDQHAFSYNSVWLSSNLTIITAILGPTVYSIHKTLILGSLHNGNLLRS